MIVETLIVAIVLLVVVVGAVTVFGSARRKQHNTKRKADLKLVQEAVEDYYSQTAKYPTINNLNDVGWVGRHLKKIKAENLRDPSQKVTNVAAAPVAGAYSYQAMSGGNQPCDNVNQDCTTYVLTATLEGRDPPYVLNNYY